MYLKSIIFNLTRIIWNTTFGICFAIFMILLANDAFAQSTSSHFFGSLTDDSEEPVGFATIGLYRIDSSLVKGGLSDINGLFEFSDIKPDDYYIEIHSVEFEKYSETFTLNNQERLDLGTIQLSSSSLSLDEVVVTSERQLIEVRPDRMVYNVESNVNAQGINALELLNQAPGVLVDPSNNITLQGKSGVRVFINGRPSRLSGEDLANFLQSMSSDNIQRIELITNPSARYEAEGNAGIIDIRLKNNVTLGYNGTIISNYSLGKESRLTNGLTLNYGKGKVGVTANITRFDNRFSFATNSITEQNGNQLDLESDDLRYRRGYNINTNLTYTFNQKHSLNASVSSVAPDGDNEYAGQTIINDLTHTSDDQLLISHSEKDYTARTLNYNLSHIWNITDNTVWSTDVSFGTYRLDQNIYQPNTYYTLGGVELRQSNNAFDPDTEIDIYSIKADFDKKIDKLSIAGGVKYYEIFTKNDFVVINLEEGVERIDDSLSNKFNYTEKVGALYLTTDYQVSAKLKANLGVRLEQTYSRGVLKSIQTLDNEDVPRDYLNVFPSASISYTSSNSEFMVSYGRRLMRPTYKYLNPFEQKINDLTIQKGNAFLNPSYTSNYQISYTYNKNLIISNSYSIIDGAFATILEAVDETSTNIIPRNMGRSTSNTLSASYQFELTDFWESNAFVTYNHYTTLGQFDETTIDITADVYTVQVQNKINLPKDITMSLDYFYNSPFIWRASQEVEGYHRVNLGLKKSFFDDNLQLRLSARDILRTSSAFYYSGEYGELKIDGVFRADNQRFGCGLTYKFGNNEIKKQRRNGGLSSELNRI